MRGFLCLFQLAFLSAIIWSCGPGSYDEGKNTQAMDVIDWQGHRGARGLMPENTTPSFLKALEYPKIRTLEMDVAVTKDSVVILSHEPWMSHQICSRLEGLPVTKEEENELYIFQMTYEEVRMFDCGSRGNEQFPEQTPMKVYKPALAEVVEAVENYCIRTSRDRPYYNIEIKTKPEWDGVRTPDVETFSSLLLQELERLKITDQTCIQSFDPRALNAVHAIDSSLKTALLVDNIDGVEGNLKKINFTPDIYSPHYKLVNSGVVREVHDKGLLLIPWTVNDGEDMEDLVDLGVDGIITDYPNRIPE
jgi:glycerophosphoryl diester phosphodiesterase